MTTINAITAKNYFKSVIKLAFLCVVLTGAARAGSYTVTTTADSGAGSFRQAITTANASPDATFTITFSIGSGLKTITLLSPLPAINLTNGTTITVDATTQGGYAGAPLIELKGTSAGAGANGLTVYGGFVTVKGFVINDFSGYGIYEESNSVPGYDNATINIYGCYIGTNASGTAANGNGNGVYLHPEGTLSNVGGTGANQRNIISGNDNAGIVTPGAYDTIKIVNNYVGTNAAGTATVPNGTDGIWIRNTAGSGTNSHLYVGGATAAERNVISGNAANGILEDAYYMGVKIRGNYIGTNASGTADLGNGANGIYTRFDGGGNSQIGGTTAADGNVISGNNGRGIRVEGTITGSFSGQYIGSNRIGTNAAGTAAIGNSLTGIYADVANVSVGGNSDTDGNTVSGNGGDGIAFTNLAINGKICNNRIGVNASGTATVPNNGKGISIAGSNVAVGYGAGYGNIIGGNASYGISLSASATDISITSNYIGTNASGADLGNGDHGIIVVSTANNSVIGGATASDGNTIAYNNGDGINLYTFFGYADNITMRGNSIYSNSGLGIDLGPTDGITANDVGDADTGANGLQNFPVLVKASPAQISGSLNSAASQTYHLDFYRSTACDGSGNGEGRYYLGASDVATDANGNANFNLAGYTIAAGQIITATATSASGDTSEFSPCVVATPPPGNLAFSTATYSVNENAVNVGITLSRTNGTDGLVAVTYTTSNGTATAGQDYPATTGTAIFLNGQTSTTVFIPITNDTTDEPAETINLALSNPTNGASLGNQTTAVLTITDDDNPPTVSINDVSKLEGNEGTTDFTFNVTLSEPSAFATSINYATANGTANATSDYQAATGTINFAAGETSKPLTVHIYGETLVEINETFLVNLSAPTLLTVADGQGAGTIQDDDNAGKLSFSLAPYNAAENSGFAMATVVRANGTAGTISVDYATTNAGTATAFADFTPVSDTLVFLDGETVKSFQIPILEDQITENTETVNLILSAPTGGATLGIAATVVNIIDNDSGTPLLISGTIKKSDNTPLAGVQMNLQGSQTLTTTTDASGNYSFSGLTPAGSFTVTPSILGYTFAPIARDYLNLAASVTNANFTATAAPVRAMRVAGGDTIGGQTATAIVELVAQGDENSVAFSLNFDQTLLSVPTVSAIGDAAGAFLTVNDAQAANGKLGVIVALPAGTTFAAGTKQLVRVVFSTVPTNAYSTALTFGDAPVQKQIVNASAGDLPSTYANGAITFAQGFEADVAPRPTGTGNGSVTIQDFSMIGNFVAGLATPDQLNEFQRADCAPLASKGDGKLRLADYTQAGRFAAGLDAVQTAGGQTIASRVQSNDDDGDKVKTTGDATNDVQSPEDAPRTVRVVSGVAHAGQQIAVSLEADALGNENGFGFTLNYDATKLGSPLVTLGADAVGATLIPNTLQSGKVGVVLALPAGTTLTAGTRQLVTVRFNVAPGAPAGQTALTFGSAPVFQEVVNANSDTLTTVFDGGAINILAPTASGASLGGRVMMANRRGIEGATVTLTDANGESRSVSTSRTGGFKFEDVPAGGTYILTVAAKRYRFTANTRVVTVVEDASDIVFTADGSGGL